MVVERRPTGHGRDGPEWIVNNTGVLAMLATGTAVAAIAASPAISALLGASPVSPGVMWGSVITLQAAQLGLYLRRSFAAGKERVEKAARDRETATIIERFRTQLATNRAETAIQVQTLAETAGLVQLGPTWGEDSTSTWQRPTEYLRSFRPTFNKEASVDAKGHVSVDGARLTAMLGRCSADAPMQWDMAILMPTPEAKMFPRTNATAKRIVAVCKALQRKIEKYPTKYTASRIRIWLEVAPQPHTGSFFLTRLPHADGYGDAVLSYYTDPDCPMIGDRARRVLIDTTPEIVREAQEGWERNRQASEQIGLEAFVTRFEHILETAGADIMFREGPEEMVTYPDGFSMSSTWRETLVPAEPAAPAMPMTTMVASTPRSIQQRLRQIFRN